MAQWRRRSTASRCVQQNLNTKYLDVPALQSGLSTHAHLTCCTPASAARVGSSALGGAWCVSCFPLRPAHVLSCVCWCLQVFKGGLSKAGMEEGIQLRCGGVSRFAQRPVLRVCLSCRPALPYQTGREFSCTSTLGTALYCAVLHTTVLCCRYFTHQELHELFKWDPAALHTSETQQLLKQQHAPQLRALQQQQSTELTSHMLWVEDNPLCAGTSQHGLLFSCEDPEGKQLNLAAADRYNGGSSSSRQQPGGGRFRDSGWHPRTGAAAGSSASSSQAGRFRGLGDAAAGGSGGGGAQPSAAALDEMMQSLHIGPGGSGRGGLTAAAAVRGTTGMFPLGSTGRFLQPHQQQQQQHAQVQELSKRIKQLQAQIQRTSTDLTLMGPSLPDGGAKVGVMRWRWVAS